MSDRIDSISNGNGHDEDDSYGLHKHDDQYYLDVGRDPPRFVYYRHVRAEKWDALEDKPSECDHSITQDELDYRLKERLRMTPEQRYQYEKASFLFHDLSCYMRG